MRHRLKILSFLNSGICLFVFVAGIICFEPVSAYAKKRNVLIYFYSNKCTECLYVRESVLPPLQKKYNSEIEFQLKEITDIENLKLLLELEKKIGYEIKKSPPLMFIGSDVLEGKNDILNRLNKILLKYSASEESIEMNSAVADITENRNDAVTEYFLSLGITAVLTGGLIDGINPCAFTTLIFLLSYLTFVGKRGRLLLFAGTGYTLGVFISYFVIGIGLFEIFQRLTFLPFAGKIVSSIVGIFSFVLALLSMYDYIQIKRGNAEKITLQLSSSLKKKIHSTIRKNARSRSTVITSVLLGVFIGILEFPCTGQVYFPIVVVIHNISRFRSQGIFYLLLYNLMFILPLVIVFAAAYFGLSSKKLGMFLQKHLAATKLMTALFFIMITMLVIVQLHLIR